MCLYLCIALSQEIISELPKGKMPLHSLFGVIWYWNSGDELYCAFSFDFTIVWGQWFSICFACGPDLDELLAFGFLQNFQQLAFYGSAYHGFLHLKDTNLSYMQNRKSVHLTAWFIAKLAVEFVEQWHAEVKDQIIKVKQVKQLLHLTLQKERALQMGEAGAWSGLPASSFL